MSNSGFLSFILRLRANRWLYSLYSRLPRVVRFAVSSKIADRTIEQFRFARTRAWQTHPTQASPSGQSPVRGMEGSGVNIFAYLRGQFGLAEAARSYASALLKAGYPVALHDIDLDLPHGLNDTSMDEHIGHAAPYPINLVFVNPDYLQEALQIVQRVGARGKPTIACWFWELEMIPDQWLPSLDSVDGVMVATSFIAEALRKRTSKPIYEVPLPVAVMPDSGLKRQDFGLPENDFLFLVSFDFNSWIVRKNPLAAINAFRQAFPAGVEGVGLLVKSSNGERYPEQFASLLEAASGDPRIIVRDDVLDRAHVQALQRCVDTYVSLHRAEGFGLGIAECMAIAKPVIATGWSGNMEFMNSKNSCLVEYDLVDVQPGEYLDSANQSWADPRLPHAAHYMRKLFDDRAFGESIGSQAAIDISQGLSKAAAAAKMIELLEKELTQRRIAARHAPRPGNRDKDDGMSAVP